MGFKLGQQIIDFLRGKNNNKDRNALGFIVEISGVCNAKCLYCYRGSGHHVSDVKFMNASKFEKVVKHAINIRMIPEGASVICLSNWGEPFMNPELNSILKIMPKYVISVKKQNFLGFTKRGFAKKLIVSSQNKGV